MAGQVYFLSDSHWGHENMVKSCTNWEDTAECRDFDSLEEHDETIIQNINKRVKEKDVLYHLGDVCMGSKDNIYRFRKRIHCKNIHLILGNHDIHIAKNIQLKTNGRDVKAQELFSTVNNYTTIRLAGKDIILFHYPILSFWKKKNTPKSSIHLYGHVHGSLQTYHPYALEVGMDAHPEFKPFSLDEVLQITEHMYKNWDFSKLIDATEDHHLKHER